MLRNACKAEFDELVGKLMGFRIKTAEMVESGGNKTKTAKAMDDLLHPLGWNETRIVGDFYIRRLSGSKPKAKMGRGRGRRPGRPRYRRSRRPTTTASRASSR
ncbi:hypothetical protein ACFQU2_39830 [Siccirubricoccus deserti]